MDKQLYHVRIHCKKSDNVLVQLCRAMEAIEIHIFSANITSHGNHIFQTLTIQVIFSIGFLLRSTIIMSCNYMNGQYYTCEYIFDIKDSSENRHC